jgi:Zn-dependent peptidase ImmA (M78 family)
MPTSKTKPKPPSLLRHGFKAEAERTAVDYRKKLDLEPHDPLPAAMLADHLQVRILTPQDIPGMTSDILGILLGEGSYNWSAAIYEREGKRYVIHNPTHSPGRQESNLMHELAHAHLMHTFSSLQTVIKNLLIPLRNYDKVQEAEAECLGSCLQLPQTALKYHTFARKKSAEQIAEQFNASLEMVNFRLRMSGVNIIQSRR